MTNSSYCASRGTKIISARANVAINFLPSGQKAHEIVCRAIIQSINVRIMNENACNARKPIADDAQPEGVGASV